MITVFYDGKCGLCRREIAYYRRIAPKGRFCWTDAAEERDALRERGLSRVDALMEMHVEDDQGRLHNGVGAFLVIWRALPWWRRLAPLVGAPVIRPAADWLYRRFAAWRFKRLDHCQIAAREEEQR